MRSRIWLAFLLVLPFTLLPKTALAQTNEITEADFWAAVRSAFAATRGVFPRREIETYEGSRADKLTILRTKTSAFAAADKLHFITERAEGSIRNVEEMIQIGKERFCKENSGQWRTSNCYSNPPAPLESALESQFRVDKSETGFTYTRRSTFLFTEVGKTEPSKYLSEDILVLNSDLSIRERTITKSALGTGVVLSRETRKYEYRLELKPIEAPIK